MYQVHQTLLHIRKLILRNVTRMHAKKVNPTVKCLHSYDKIYIAKNQSMFKSCRLMLKILVSIRHIGFSIFTFSFDRDLILLHLTCHFAS